MKYLRFQILNSKFFCIKRVEGVSLFELIIAITISGFVLTGVMMSYVSLTKAAQKIDISRQLQREINFAMARISDRVRGFSVDYENSRCEYIYNQEDLCIKGENIFEFVPATDESSGQLNMNGEPLFSKLFSVKAVLFTVTPTKDPKENFSNEQIQPRVQVYLRVGLAEGVKISMEDFEIQTTLSSRLYQ